MLIVLISSVFSSTAISQISDLNYNDVKINYNKALKEISSTDRIMNLSISEEDFLKNSTVINDKLMYSNILSDGTTISASETGYAVARIENNSLIVIENQNGKTERHKINIDKIQDKAAKTLNQMDLKTTKNNLIQPREIEYSKELDSYKGYFEFYQALYPNNLRSYTLTVPNGGGSGQTQFYSRSTSASNEQNFESIAFDFLNQLDLALDTASDLKRNWVDAAAGSLSFIPGFNESAAAVNAVLVLYETGHDYTEEGLAAAMKTYIVGAWGIASDYVGQVNTFVNTGLGVANSVVYRVQLRNLNNYYQSFKTA